MVFQNLQKSTVPMVIVAIVAVYLPLLFCLLYAETCRVMALVVQAAMVYRDTMVLGAHDTIPIDLLPSIAHEFTSLCLEGDIVTCARPGCLRSSFLSAGKRKSNVPVSIFHGCNVHPWQIVLGNVADSRHIK